MTTQELDTEFDVLFNNITSNQSPGLDIYEKSVFCTKAQAQLVREYFSFTTDRLGGGFDGNQKRQYDFSYLIRTIVNSSEENTDSLVKIDSRSHVFKKPKDVFMILNEKVTALGSQEESFEYTVVPLSYSEYQRVMRKPYKYPLKNTAWRLDNRITEFEEDENSDYSPFLISELIGKFPKDYSLHYTIRYIPKLRPIILGDLSSGLEIDGEDSESVGSLPEETHREILERAVTLAKIAWQGGTISQVAQSNN